MPPKRRSKSPRQQAKAEILYFLEDGSISHSPGGPEASKKSGRASDGLEDFPWPPQAAEGVPCDEFGFPLPDPGRPVTADQEVEEIDPDDEAIEISSVSEISDLPDGFDEASAGEGEGEAGDAGEDASASRESTQIETIDAPAFDVGSMADEFERALSEACSDDSAARTLAEMPTVKPMPASEWPKTQGSVRSRQVPLSLSAKSFSANTLSGIVKSAAKAASQAGTGASRQDKQEKSTPPPSAAAAERRERKSEAAVSAPVSPVSSEPASVFAPAAKSSPSKKPAVSAAEDDETAASAVCLLSSDAAKTHYRRLLKGLADEGSGKRSDWASAALFGQELFATGRSVPARKIFERIISEGAAEAFPFAMLGALHLAQGDDGEARKLFDQALRISPDDVAALLGRAETFIRTAEPSAAMADVRRALGQATFESSPLLTRAEAMMGVVQKLMRFLG